MNFLHNLADRRKHAHTHSDVDANAHPDETTKRDSLQDAVPEKHAHDNYESTAHAQGHPTNGNSEPVDTTSDAQLAQLLQEQENARGDPVPKPIIRLSSIGHGLTIRPYHPSDAAQLASIANNKNISMHMTDRFPFPYSLQDAEEFIAKTLHAQSSNMYAWAVTNGGSHGPLIGGIGLEPGADVWSRTAEIGYWLAETAWGKGYASALCAAFTDWAFQREEGINGYALQRIGAGVFSGNPASGKVLKSAGYKHEGTMQARVYKWGEVRDLEVWGLTRKEWEKRRKRKSTKQQLRVMEMAEGTMIGNVDSRMEI